MKRSTQRLLFLALIVIPASLLFLFLAVITFGHPKREERILMASPKAIGRSDRRYAIAFQAITGRVRKEARTRNGRSDDVLICEGDFDGDGKPDRIEGEGMTVSLLTSKQGLVRESSGGSGVSSVGFDDIDGDGFRDAWFIDEGDVFIEIWWGDGQGHIRGRQALLPGIRAERGAVLDLDSDGDKDIVFDTSDGETSRTLWWMENVTPKRNTQN